MTTLATRTVPRAVTISAWSVPVLVIGQFAFVALLPVLVALAGSLRSVEDRLVRWAAAVLAVVYAVPFLIWAVNPDGAPSLSKDIHPGFVVAIVAVAAALVLAIHTVRRR